ncbi:TlpA disulfide reductase family protein [uncultured Polaribacter sp.]|uniref:TlpA family protein disulfide reductase n=1 Tax=uncultured Polaribacter sp. TaxID=174711 RepID=UPI0026323AFE|nr:TlpA disulfide reductase family protein [uncultured Polaribacter sp.]
MKNLLQQLFVGIILIFLIVACKKTENHSERFIVTGFIEGLEGNLYYTNPYKKYSPTHPFDSIIVKNGEFIFSDTISELTLIKAYTKFSEENKLYKKPNIKNGIYPVPSMYLMFFAFPNAEIDISGVASDFMDAYPSGDEYNNSLAEINKFAFPSFNKSVNLLVKSTFEKDTIKSEILKKQSQEISETGRLARIDHIREHQNSLGALWYLNNMVLQSDISDSLALAIFNNVSPNLHHFEIYRTLEEYFDNIKVLKEGNPVPKIKTKSTLNGEEFNLTSLKGKYVLIDFWGIWCRPCVEEMPKVKLFQKRYKDKFAVLGINSGDSREKIQTFIDENKYEWQHILNQTDDTTNDFLKKFNVKGFPTKYIIDPEGKIVKSFLGGGDEAFTLLEKLLN